VRQPPPGLIHHTDRGGQYAGAAYRRMLARAAMPQSMSRADDCYDNAFMESCFGTLKTELEMKPYESPRIARKEVPEFIRYYNTRRRHSSLDYLTPEAFEQRHRTETMAVRHGVTRCKPRRDDRSRQCIAATAGERLPMISSARPTN
jgi:transposase InsO family protein